jgi:hypothetical protein
VAYEMVAELSFMPETAGTEELSADFAVSSTSLEIVTKTVSSDAATGAADPVIVETALLLDGRCPP